MKKLSKTKQYQLEEEMHQVATLYKALAPLGLSQLLDRLIVKGVDVKLASWDESLHNSDIRNYKERTPMPGELLHWIPELEKAFRKKAWDDHMKKVQDEALAEFYDRNRISHTLV